MPSVGIRGSNPIWVEVDLTANLFDDTFYLFVLTNTIPYIPANVYHDPDLMVPWTQPIQFLANGTLPIDIFFVPNTIYRLEFRQGPTQSDPLIYEVNNYSPGSGGSTPIDTVALTSSNQISNPQFSQISFISPLMLTGVTNQTVKIGPDWFLVLTGTGSVTATQLRLNNTNINPSNAPYALQLNLSGWTEAVLRQRFFQNGMLWANKSVASAITAISPGVPLPLTANLVDSNGTPLGQVLNVPAVDGVWTEYSGVATLPATTNPNTPPAAYIDYLLTLPNNGQIAFTSIQLVVEDIPVELSFIQDSINRQIDQLYHAAYPIVPIGTVIDFYGFGVPTHYLSCNGQAVNRQTFNELFNTVTNVETVVLSIGTPTFSVANGLLYAIGAPIESTGFPGGTTIANIVTNTITTSNNATANGSTPVRFFTAGNGDGSTTFNIPNLQGFTLAGAGANAGAFLASSGVGTGGGNALTTLLATNLPPHIHTYATPTAVGAVFSAPAAGFQEATNQTGTGTDPSGTIPLASTPFSNVQPTILAQKMIRYE